MGQCGGKRVNFRVGLLLRASACKQTLTVTNIMKQMRSLTPDLTCAAYLLLSETCARFKYSRAEADDTKRLKHTRN